MKQVIDTSSEKKCSPKVINGLKKDGVNQEKKVMLIKSNGCVQVSVTSNVDKRFLNIRNAILSSTLNSDADIYYVEKFNSGASTQTLLSYLRYIGFEFGVDVQSLTTNVVNPTAMLVVKSNKDIDKLQKCVKYISENPKKCFKDKNYIAWKKGK